MFLTQLAGNVVACGLALGLALSPLALAQPASATAEQMAAALKASPDGIGQLPALSMMGELTGEEKAAFDGAYGKAVEIITATTKEPLSGQQKMQLGIDVIGWLLSRRPLTAASTEMYLSRYSKLDKATIDEWRVQQAKSGEIGNSTSLTMSAIVFKDFLWDKGEWTSGNPARALKRLGSLSKDAVSRWNAVASRNDGAVYGAWSLLSVDSLFADDVFQQSKFDAALPLAEKDLK